MHPITQQGKTIPALSQEHASLVCQVLVLAKAIAFILNNMFELGHGHCSARQQMSDLLQILSVPGVASVWHLNTSCHVHT